MSQVYKKAATATGILMILTVISKIAGFFRDSLMAGNFGTGSENDAYVMAATIPRENFLVLAAALGTAFIPVFNSLMGNNNKKDAERYANNIISLSIILFTVVSISGILFAPSFIPLIAKGYDSEKLTLTIRLSRIMMPLMLLIIINQLLSSICYSFEKFAAPAAAPLVNNLLMAAYLIFFVKRYGIGGLSVVTVFSFLVQVSVIYFALRNTDFRFRFTIDFKDPNLSRLINLAWPVLIGSSVQWGVNLVNKYFASQDIAGTVSALYFSNVIHSFSVGLFSGSLVLVVYPYFSKLAAAKDFITLKSILVKALNAIFILLIPISAGVIVLRYPVVKLLFEHGDFGANATSMTASALLFYTLGLFAHGLREILIRAFYSIEDTMTPVKYGIVGALANIILVIFLIPLLSYRAIPLAISVSYFVSFSLLGASLYKKLDGYDISKVLSTAFKTILAALAMGTAVYFLNSYLVRSLNESTINQLINILACILSGGLLYGLLLKILRVEDFNLYMEFAFNKFKEITRRTNR